MKLNDWIYIYYITEGGQLVYDTTVSRHGLGPQRAKDKVAQHEKLGREAFYTIGTVPKAPAFY